MAAVEGVVVENVERIMAEEGLPPREATRKVLKETPKEPRETRTARKGEREAKA